MNERILLVDDEEGIRKVLGISLMDMGYRVFTAENGEEAIRVFKKEQPSIVLTDIKMPGMDGIEVLKKIKQEDPEVEVIVITGHGDMDLAIKSLKYEATDFITKPIDDSALERALDKSRRNIINRNKLREYTESLETLVKKKSERLALAGGAPEDMEVSQRYRSLFDEMPGYVTVHDRKYRIIASNRQFKNDFMAEEKNHALCYEVLMQRKAPCVECPVMETFETGAPGQREMKFKSPVGKEHSVFTLTTPLRNSSGEINRVMAISTDISQILDLKDHLSSLGLMLGSVSHGIKGLLTGLDGGMYLLDSGFSRDDPDKVNEGLDILKLLIGRMRSMVLDVLYYAKERATEKSRVGVAGFAAEVAGVVESKMKDMKVAFEKDFVSCPEDLVMDADPDQLSTALVNILENATDACADKRDREEKKVLFSLAHDKDSVVFKIRDNGVGMDERTRNRIFDLFFSSKSTKGTGIGLFVSKKIVEQHGGEISVESEPGTGACFTVTIPKAE